MMGVETTVPRIPPLLVAVHGAATSDNIVNGGTVPPDIRAVIARYVLTGTTEETFTYTAEFDTDVTGRPAFEVLNVKLTVAWLVLIRQ